MRLTNDKPETVMVVWELTTVCNYHCWYCEDYYHNGKYRWPDLNASLDFFYELCSRHKNVHVDIQGGEPTLWPKLSEFMDQKPKNLSVEITSNGSRTVEWWVKNYKKFDMITFSFHPDSADSEHYKKMLTAIADGTNHVHVFLLAVSKHREKLVDLFDFLKSSDLKLDCSFKILFGFARDAKFDEPIHKNNEDFDLEYFQKMRFFRNTVTETVKPQAAYIDGERLDFTELKINNKEDFRGWHCKAGITRFFIRGNGDIYRGFCENDGKIGNIYFDTHVYDLQPTICKTFRCGCRDDIVTEKWKID